MEKRFEGEECKYLENVILLGACNPFRKLKTSEVVNVQTANSVFISAILK